MAGNPWRKRKSSPWVLMVGSGSVGDFWEVYEGFGPKEGRTVKYALRPWSVAYLKLTLDHLIRTGPRLIRDPKTVRGKYDFYFDRNTDNRVRAFQHGHKLSVDGIVGKDTMAVFWDIGRSDRLVRKHEREISKLMLDFIRTNRSSYKRVD